MIGNHNAFDAITEEFHIKKCLHLIGFLTAAHKNPIYNNHISSYGDLCIMTSNDIELMTKYYGGQPTTDKNIDFGIRSIMKLKLLIH